MRYGAGGKEDNSKLMRNAGLHAPVSCVLAAEKAIVLTSNPPLLCENNRTHQLIGLALVMPVMAFRVGRVVKHGSWCVVFLGDAEGEEGERRNRGGGTSKG